MDCTPTHLAEIVKRWVGRGAAPPKYCGIPMIEMCDSVIEQDKPTTPQRLNWSTSLESARSIKADMNAGKIVTHDRIMDMCVARINEENFTDEQ